MRIRTLWEHSHPNDAPWLVEAIDEYTEEEHGGTPAFYDAAMKDNPRRRELYIHVPDSAVRDLFTAPHVEGTIKPSSAPKDDGEGRK